MKTHCFLSLCLRKQGSLCTKGSSTCPLHSTLPGELLHAAAASVGNPPPWCCLPDFPGDLLAPATCQATRSVPVRKADTGEQVRNQCGVTGDTMAWCSVAGAAEQEVEAPLSHSVAVKWATHRGNAEHVIPCGLLEQASWVLQVPMDGRSRPFPPHVHTCTARPGYLPWPLSFHLMLG